MRSQTFASHYQLRAGENTAASATLGVPTAPLELLGRVRHSTAERSSRGRKRTGTSSFPAASSSPDFVALYVDAGEGATLFRTDRPPPETFEQTDDLVRAAPRLQPTPATSEGGR